MRVIAEIIGIEPPAPRSGARTGVSGETARSGLLIGVQALRGCAALLVILAHANLMMRYPRYFQASPFDIRDSGVFGVAIFFAISGFIIAIVSLDGRLQPRLRAADFAWRRFVRIMPFLWVAVIAYNLLTFVGTGQVEWLNALRAMVIWPIGGLKPNVIWSLRHELIFYGLFAVAMLLSRRRVWLLVAWFVAPLVYGTLIGLAGPGVVPDDPHLAELLRVLLLGSENGANLQFGAGFALGLLYVRGHALTRVRRIGGIAGVVLIVTAATVLVESSGMVPGLGRTLVWTILSAIILWSGIVCDSSPRWLERVWILLGNASFAIYLTHNGALLTAFEAVSRTRIALPTQLLFFVFVALAIGVGVAVHFLVERPLIAALTARRAIMPSDRRRAM